MIRDYCLSVARHFTALAELEADILRAGALWRDCLAGGGKILFCGNGGSAADSQHLAAELTGRYRKERQPLAGIALSVDTSALTAIGNDYGFDQIFARQLAAIGQPGDLLVAFSTSGNSPNILAAAATARQRGIACLALTGQGGGKLKALADLALCVPSDQTNHIQEMHIAIGHMLCTLVEQDCA